MHYDKVIPRLYPNWRRKDRKRLNILRAMIADNKLSEYLAGCTAVENKYGIINIRRGAIEAPLIFWPIFCGLYRIS